jgi:hypothetical protein
MSSSQRGSCSTATSTPEMNDRITAANGPTADAASAESTTAVRPIPSAHMHAVPSAT